MASALPLVRRGVLDDERKPTHVCLDCGALGYAGGYHHHWEDSAGDTVALADLPEWWRRHQGLIASEGEAEELGQEIERLEGVVAEMAAQLAFCVRIGTGVNLQATTARKTLARHGYTLDRQGWLEGEPGYNPEAPPWEEETPPVPYVNFPHSVGARPVNEEDDVVPF